MAKLVYGMNVSLDGYVDHEAFAPGVALFQYWIDQTRTLTGSIYGRGLYELMRYWDDDQPEWGAQEKEFAEAYRAMPKWVASRSLKEVGPNATLLGDDVEGAIRTLKAERDGRIDVGGPKLAASVLKWGLIDEVDMYLRPYVLGKGAPFFTEAQPPLRFVGSERVGEDAVRVTYAPG